MTNVHVVTHTHWDREWYLSFEVFRSRLLELVERLIEIMRKDPNYRFHLDGQTVILEDYAEVGENLQELLDLIREGRVSVGPWYVLPDEFLITGEAWIRNYLYSRKVAENFGIPLSKVGYLPDMFGHNAYMPTVLKGLGMEWAVLWRGVGDEKLETFVWSSPTGDEVNVYHLIHGYGNASHQGKNVEEFMEKLLKEARALRRISSNSSVLLMNGTDHELPLPNMGNILKELSKDGFHFIHSDLERFLSEVKSPEAKITGELRNSRKEPVLKDVTSTRVSGKRLHFEAEVLYERYVEPLMALALLSGERLPLKELWYGWKLILQSQPHDSICGCGTDEVHESVLDRLKRAVEHGKMLCTRTVKKLAKEVKSEMGVMVFNPFETENDAWVETVVYLPRGDWKVEGAQRGYVKPLETKDFYSVDIRESLAFRFLSENSVDAVIYSDAVPHICCFKASLPALALKSFRIVPGESSEVKKISSSPFTVMDNGTLKVHWNGYDYEALCYLKDVGDAGDEYNFSPVSGNPYTSLDVKAEKEEVFSFEGIRREVVKFVMRLPKELAPDRKQRSSELVEVPVRIEYTFYDDTPRVDVKLDLENKVKDHRLTFVLPLGEITELYTEGYFGMVKHEVRDYSGDYSDWVELPENTFATWSFVTIPERRITVAGRGLHEVHVTEDGLEVTLLRGVEWLSRGDLLTRKGHAGPAIMTPGAQELGQHSFEFSLIFHEEWNEMEVYRKAKMALLRPMVWQVECETKDYALPFTVDRGILSALKPSEDGEGLILRVFDPAGEKPLVRFSTSAEEVNLAEQSGSGYEGRALKTWKLLPE